MKENKKWELIAKAHQEYPKGTKVQWGDTILELDGKYQFFDSATIVDSKGSWAYFNGDWAIIVTDKPVFILRSEDGVDLYEGDDQYNVCKDIYTNIWKFNAVTKAHRIFSKPVNPAFSTKEAAEAWCKEQNKVKEVTIPIGSAHLIDAVITKYKVTLNRKYGGDHTLSASEIESIWKAYQSLQ